MILHRISTWRNKIDSNLLELLTGSSVAFALKVVGAGLTFAFNVVLARLLGPDGAGLYFLSLSAVSLAVVFGRMGLDKTVLRLVSANADHGNWPAVRGVQYKASIMGLASGSVITAILLILSPRLAITVFGKPEVLAPLRWMSLAILPMTFNFVYTHLLKGKRLIFQATLIESVSVAAVSFALFYLIGRYYSVQGAVWSYVVAASATAFLAFFFWAKGTPQLRNVRPRFDTRTILESSMPLFWVALTTWIISRFGDFALGIWSTAAEVGIFGVATRTALFISFALMAVNSIAAPQFAALYDQNDRTALAKSAQNAMRLTAIGAAPLTIACVVAPRWIMSIFGPGFSSGSNVLVIVALAQFVNASTGPVELLLMMSGKERLVRTNVILVGTLNIILYILLTPLYGAFGAAIAFAIGLVAKNLTSVWLVKRYLALDLLRLHWAT